MRFSGKMTIFWCMILGLVLFFQMEVKAQSVAPTAKVEILPLDEGLCTNATPTFTCMFRVGLAPEDSAWGVGDTTVLFRLRKPPFTGPAQYIVIFNGDNIYYGEEPLTPGFTMSKDSTVDARGNVTQVVYTFAWDTLAPADTLIHQTYRVSLRGIYDIFMYNGYYNQSVNAPSDSFIVTRASPLGASEMTATLAPSLLDTVPPKPLFDCKFRIKDGRATWRSYAKDVPDDSLKLVVERLVGGSTIVFDHGLLTDGFRMSKKEYKNQSTGADTAVEYFFAWDTADPASPLAVGQYRCIASGMYEFNYDPSFDSLIYDTVMFTVGNSPPVSQGSLTSVTTRGLSSIPGIVSGRPWFRNAFRLISLVAGGGVGVPDSTLSFVIFDSAGDTSAVLFDGDVQTGFRMIKQEYDTAFPGADSTDILVGWNPVNPADSLVDGKYYCKVQGGYDVGWILPSEDSLSFEVFGTAPRIALLHEGYVNSKGALDFFLRSYGISYGNFLDTANFYIDLYLVNLPNTDSEERRFIKTILPSDIRFGSAEAETVMLDPSLNLTDGLGLDLFMYNGITPDRSAYVDSADRSTAYPDSLSCADLVGNTTGKIFERSMVDGLAPQVTMLDSTDKAWKFAIYDAGSGVNDNSIVVKIDGTRVTSDTIVRYDPTTDILTYYPTNLGALLSITALDQVGNKGSYSAYVQTGKLLVRDVHSFPNPFNPIKGEKAKIVFKSNRENNQDVKTSAEVYDLAGKHIATLEQNTDGELIWNGRTEGGQLVANGVYLCYMKIEDLKDLKVENYLLKVAVIKKD